MKSYFLATGDMDGFVNSLIDSSTVIAPVSKRSRFVFDEVSSADEVRLDYDTTILPPKKVIFPTKQDLVCFDENGYKSCLDPKAKILFGVHPHDIKAIAMTDALFTDNYPDSNYLANRNALTIVGTDVQNPYKHAFFGSICQDVPATGHDLFITKISDGYVVKVITDKGEKLIASGSFVAATDAQIAEADKVSIAAASNCPETLNGTASEIADKVRGAFKNEIWEALSKDCFSCGSCNIVCPTCYCFDVQDEWGLGKCDGKRYRRWDACLTPEFSEVSVQGGSENFREERAERYRHRFMRKTSYLNDKLGNPACIGCGRCSGTCTADIANPVTTINKILEEC